MKFLSVTVIALTLFILSGCSMADQAANDASTNDVKKTPAKTASNETPAPANNDDDVVAGQEQKKVVVYVANDDADGLLRKQVDKVEDAEPDTAEVLTLLSGPNTSPEGTKLLGVSIENGLAVVDLSKEFESGGGTSSVTFRVAEIVFTLTERPDVDSVKIIIEGQHVEYITGEGFLVAKPFTRKDFPDLKITN